MNKNASLMLNVLRKAPNLNAPTMMACGYTQTTRKVVNIDFEKLNVVSDDLTFT